MTRPAADMTCWWCRWQQTRDRAAFAALFAHFAPRVKAWLMRQGAPPAQAEDLAQEALLMVWRKAPLFDPAKASAGTWVFTIARNLRIDAIRRERRPELDPEDFLPDSRARRRSRHRPGRRRRPPAHRHAPDCRPTRWR